MRRRNEIEGRSLITPGSQARVNGARSPNAAASSGGGERATIVIAEDDLTTRLVLQQVLVREGFRVIAVENGRLACEAVRNERPDVVLLDWLMPVMDGRAALEELKSTSDTRGIPIVMLTSNAQVDDRITALESGVQDFLSKPFDPRELIACIEQQLRWRRRLAVDADVKFVAERHALHAASERRYRLLAEAMPHIVWIADEAGQIDYLNRAWYDYVGHAPQGTIATAWMIALHPEDREPSLRAWSASLESGRPYEIQCRLRRASDGMYRWHVARAMPTSDEHGRIVEWIGSCSDIHDYRIASETRAILDTIGSIVTIRQADGFVDYCGPHWTSYTGSVAGSALGLGWRDFVHPDDLGPVEQHRRDVCKAPDDALVYELRLRRHDGSFRWFLARTQVLPGPSDAPRRWLDTATDVDDLKRTQAALAMSESRYRALTDSMPQMVWVIGDDDTCEYVNHRWREYTGLDVGATRADGPASIVHPEDRVAFDGICSAAAHGEYTCEARFRRSDGVFRWQALRAVPFADAGGGARKWIGTATDIEDSKAAAAQLARTAEKLEHLAHHDPMTDLPNRTLLSERLAQAIALAQRAKTQVLVLYVDLDRFKIINDTRGHAAGDRVLAATGARITEALRAGDTASRVGGDEFVLVCATGEAANEAARLATRLLAAIGEPIDLDGEAVNIGASIGISMYPADGLTGEELIRKADSAMYCAKESGRNAFRIYEAETHSSSVAALDLEADLRRALARGEIVVHYEPILDLRTDRLIGAEACVRWQHARRGLLQPAAFLPFAQARGMGGQIEAIVRDAVCAEIARLGPDGDDGFRFSMNVSENALARPDWIGRVTELLRGGGGEPSRLQIDIAESAITTESAAVRSALEELLALGIALAVDDFGTGLSSLAAMKTVPLRSLKIARSFVAGLASDDADNAIVRTIVTLARGLSLTVVAVGVDTRAQRDALRACGVDAVQGAVCSAPLPAPELRAFLDRARGRRPH